MLEAEKIAFKYKDFGSNLFLDIRYAFPIEPERKLFFVQTGIFIILLF
jgi:hypothetical protein